MSPKLCLQTLNSEQRAAVTTLHGPLLVIAGAGTGKTKVITTRVAHLIETGVAPESIVAVSFTNKASREMEHRLKELVGNKLALRCRLSTFHSFALDILKTWGNETIGEFKIADEVQSNSLLGETLRELHLDQIMSLETARFRISQLKDQLLDESDLSSHCSIFEAKLLAKLFKNYNQRLRFFGLVEFDDIVYLTARLLRSQNRICAEIRAQYKYILVDEFQDTSYGQFEFVKLLSGNEKNVCAVGDDDQSIYSWRGARPTIIQEFLNYFIDAKKVTLSQNYRCSQKILDLANASISRNTNRQLKSLWSNISSPYAPCVYGAQNPRDEALWITNQIGDMRGHALVGKSEMVARWKDFTILIRSSSQTQALEMVLEERKIPFRVYGSKELYDVPEIRELLSFLALSLDSHRVTQIYNVLKIQFLDLKLDTFLDFFGAHRKLALQGELPKNALEYLINETNVLGKYRDYLVLLKNFVQKREHCCDVTSLKDWFKEAYEDFGLKKKIQVSSPRMKTALDRQRAVENFYGTLEKRYAPNKHWDSFLGGLLQGSRMEDTMRSDLDEVSILTIHSAKGLEFPFVFIPGLEEGTLPHEKSMNSDALIEEERRLFYVGLTRAKFGLFLSYSCNYGKLKKGEGAKLVVKSRFLEEIDHITADSDTSHKDPEQLKIELASKLFDLFR